MHKATTKILSDLPHRISHVIRRNVMERPGHAALADGATVVAALYPADQAGQEEQAARDHAVQVWGWDRGLPIPRPLGRAGLVTVSEDLGDEDLDRAEAWFDRRGEPVVLFGRFIPLLRSFVSFAAIHVSGTMLATNACSASLSIDTRWPGMPK